MNDAERNPAGATKGGGLADHGDFGYPRAKLIPLHGCCNSEASQLLNNRMFLHLLLVFELKRWFVIIIR